MSVLVVTGTGTGVGKTVVTAAVAAAALAGGRSVTVVKPAQTGVGPGEPGDVDEVRRLAGDVPTVELVRYREPLAPATAARLSGAAPLDRRHCVDRIRAVTTDLVLVEGAGGLLVRYDDDGLTLADVAADLDAPVLVVTTSGLGALNPTALTLEALDLRGLALAGLVVGAWPREPGLADRTNLADLETLAGVPLAGLLPVGAAALDRAAFRRTAICGLGPSLGGTFDAVAFRAVHGAETVPAR